MHAIGRATPVLECLALGVSHRRFIKAELWGKRTLAILSPWETKAVSAIATVCSVDVGGALSWAVLSRGVPAGFDGVVAF